MKKIGSLLKISAIISMIFLFSACSGDNTANVEFSYIPSEINIKENETQTVVLLASIEDYADAQKDYIKKIEVLTIDNVADEEYIGVADIILNAESDGVSSKSFDITGVESGMVAFDIVLNITQQSAKEEFEIEKTARLVANILLDEESQNEITSMPNEEISQSSNEDKEAQAVVDAIPVSGERIVPNFPNLMLPEYININKGQTFRMSLNQDLQGHTIDMIKYSSDIVSAYKSNDERSNLPELVVTAGPNTAGGYIDIYLSYPNYFYSDNSNFLQENPHGPYYRAENGYLVIRYDVNTKDIITEQPRDYYVENESNKELPKDYYEEYNPMIKN